MGLENMKQNIEGAETAENIREKELNALAAEIKKEFLESIHAGDKFTIMNISTTKSSHVETTGKRDADGYYFVKELGLNHSVITNKDQLLQSEEGKTALANILDKKGLSLADKKIVAEKLGL